MAFPVFASGGESAAPSQSAYVPPVIQHRPDRFAARLGNMRMKRSGCPEFWRMCAGILIGLTCWAV
jgi:hypothetical protein